MQVHLKGSHHKAPREYYGPRELIPGDNGRRSTNRHYNKSLHNSRGREKLPDGWNVLCPNRIAEVRMAHGYETTMALVKSMNNIVYLRMRKMETGRVVIRDSEYDLIARHLGINAEKLRLPLLTQSETVEWNSRWGPDKQIEEGGDHDSVVLAAYLRYHLSRHEISYNRLCNQWDLPPTSINKIYHAEKPIDRYSDSAMLFMLKLTGFKTWDKVIADSQRIYNSGALFFYVDQVKAPRKRYAPEDPDRKAPWTYDINPNRPKKHRRMVETPLSATLDDYKQSKMTPVKKRQAAASKRIDENIKHVLAKGVEQTLHGLFPNDEEAIAKLMAHDWKIAQTVAIRARTIRMIEDSSEHQKLAERLGISRERIRQIAEADAERPGLRNYYTGAGNIKLAVI